MKQMNHTRLIEAADDRSDEVLDRIYNAEFPNSRLKREELDIEFELASDPTDTLLFQEEI